MSVKNGKVSGRTVEVAVEGVMSVFRRRIRSMLDDNGITEPDPEPDTWYQMEDFLQVLEDVEEDAGGNALNKIGEATPTYVEWPTDPGGPGEALESLTDVYREHHRNATGSYEVESTGPESARITVDTPYPCEFDLGLIKGTVEEYGASYGRIDEVGDECRDEGCDACTYEITW